MCTAMETRMKRHSSGSSDRFHTPGSGGQFPHSWISWAGSTLLDQLGRFHTGLRGQA